MNTLIIEDESYIRKGLITLIDSLDKGLSIIGECEGVEEAITVTKACKPELIFLDINLKDGNAFDFLEKTNHLKYKVIFITAYEQYALQALKKGAIDYILKPIDIEELEIAIDKAINTKIEIPSPTSKHSIGDNKLVLRLHDSFQIIPLNELEFCISDKGYTTFHLSSGKSVVASKPLKEFENKLTPPIFIRTHQSYFVNLNFVDSYDKKGLAVLKGGQKIPVSTRKKDEFLKLLLDSK